MYMYMFLKKDLLNKFGLTISLIDMVIFLYFFQYLELTFVTINIQIIFKPEHDS